MIGWKAEADMLIEQVRYFFEDARRAEVLGARRELSRLRQRMGVAVGAILIPDEAPTEEPAIVWQCGYADEDEMSASESALLGSKDYEAARHHMSAIVKRVEMQLYISDDEPL
jgi:hypothetical protein